jgi:hypothetical protein
METGAGDVGKATDDTTLFPARAENVAAETGIWF